MNINDKVMIYNTGDSSLNGQTGTLVGRRGADFPIVLFDEAPEGYDPTICIMFSCVKPAGKV